MAEFLSKSQIRKQIDLLCDVFPQTRISEIRRALQDANGDVETTISELSQHHTDKVETKLKEFDQSLNSSGKVSSKHKNELKRKQKQQQQQQIKAHEEALEKRKLKLRPANQIYFQILWDPTLLNDQFIIGFEDRFDGIVELPLSQFSKAKDLFADAFIPFHRVRYIKRGNDTVWDRSQRIDLLH